MKCTVWSRRPTTVSVKIVVVACLDEERFLPGRYWRRPEIKYKTENKKRKIHMSVTASSSLVTHSNETSTVTSGTSKICKTLNQSSILNGNFDQRLILFGWVHTFTSTGNVQTFKVSAAKVGWKENKEADSILLQLQCIPLHTMLKGIPYCFGLTLC